jgi:hypothetical protein
VVPTATLRGFMSSAYEDSITVEQALPGGQVQTPLGPGDEARSKEQERKGGVQGFLQ